MNSIERDEIEEIMTICAWARKLVSAMLPALEALERKVREIEKTCRVCEFRLDYKGEEEEEDED